MYVSIGITTFLGQKYINTKIDYTLGIKNGKKLMDISLGFTKFLGDEHINTEVDYSLPSDWFPCLLVIAGSGNPILKVHIPYIVHLVSTISECH